MKITKPAGTPETIEHPDHPDGHWPFLMIHGEMATWADTRTELVGALIDGYDDFTDDVAGNNAAFEARYVQAVAVATDVQTSILLDASDQGDFDPDEMLSSPLGDARLQALMIERTVAFENQGVLAERVDADGKPEWDFKVPLVLVTTDYEPYTGRPAPTGRVIMVDPSTESTYLNSLMELGRVVLFIHEPAS